MDQADLGELDALSNVAGMEGLTENQVHLPILATSDLHAALLAYDYFRDRPNGAASVARLARVIGHLRSNLPNCLLVDNGDSLQGSPIAEAHVAEGSQDIHPVIEALNHLRYDAVALGNHEFNLEPRDLRAALRAARFPVLCANLRETEHGASEFAELWRAGVILEHETQTAGGAAVTLRIGVLGVLPPQVLQWDSLRIGSALVACDLVEAARAEARRLRAQGADIVLALTHTGISGEPHVEGAENAAHMVAKLVEIDAVVAGHIHKQFPGAGHPEGAEFDADRGTIHGTPVVMPGAYASHLGRIDLVLEPGAGGWRVAGHRSALIPAGGVGEDPETVRRLARAQTRALAAIRRPVGRLTTPVHSYFAMVQDDLSVRIVAEAMLEHLRAEIAGSQWAGLPVLASVAPMKCGGRAGGAHYTDIAAGPIAMRAVADLQLFENHLRVLRLKAAELAEWLEMSASLYNRLRPGAREQLLFGRDTPTYNREAIYGLSYAIDLTQPARYDMRGQVVDTRARRVRDLSFEGAPLDPGQDFLLATNEFRAGGGGHYPGIAPDRIEPIPPVAVREVLAAYLQAGTREIPAAPSWRFHPMPGVTAVFDTGAAAVGAELPDGLAIRPLGPREGGFYRFRLDLGADVRPRAGQA